MKSLSCVRPFVTPWTVACTRLLCPWDFLGKSTGVGCHFLLQGEDLEWELLREVKARIRQRNFQYLGFRPFKEGGHLGQVLTGLAGVSSRTCRLPAPQTDAEAATAWSSSGELSTGLCMILLIRTVTMSLRLQRGEKYNGEMMGNT